MQKSLDQMNVCVHHAVSDITGATGMAIIRAIVDGERDPLTLAKMRDRRCQKSEQQIADELTGNWRPEHLFNLRQALKMYDQFCQTVAEYDAEILAYIQTLQPATDDDPCAPPPMRQALYELTGFDLSTIDGIGVDTAAVVVSELGPDFSAFADESHFVAYLRLAPNLSISAGKKVPSKLKGTTTSRVGSALRMAALALRNSKTALGAFYRRISRRKGASVAVFATARKLAQIIYRLVCYGQAYIDIGAKAYENQFNSRRLIHFTRALKDMGYKVELLPTEAASSVG
jgi:transposase